MLSLKGKQTLIMNYIKYFFQSMVNGLHGHHMVHAVPLVTKEHISEQENVLVQTTEENIVKETINK